MTVKIAAGGRDHFRGVSAAFIDLAQVVSEPAGSAKSGPDQLRCAALGYREWSLGNPNRFSLIFGTPVPGYIAPEYGPTTEAAARLGLAWGQLFAAGMSDGSLDVDQWDGDTIDEARSDISLVVDVTSAGIRATGAWWALVHGLVVIEMQRHFTWVIADQDEHFLSEINRWLEQVSAR